MNCDSHEIVAQYRVPLVSAVVNLGIFVVTNLIVRGAQNHQFFSQKLSQNSI